MMSTTWSLSGLESNLVRLLILILLIASFRSCFVRFSKPKDKIEVANRTSPLEPRFFALVRWAYKARTILDSAYHRFNGIVYKIALGDNDLTVVPSTYLTELNLLPETRISSKKAHAHNLAGKFNGMDVVTQTDLHRKVVQHKLTPALPRLLKPMKARIGEAIGKIFPTDSETWTTVKPMEKILHCVGMSNSMAAVGTPLCDNPEYVRLSSEHAKHAFSVTMILRLIPKPIRPLVVWLLPAKWRLEQSFRSMASFVVPEARHRETSRSGPIDSDMLSWMMREAKNEQEKDPEFLTLLQAMIAAGATHTSAMLIYNVLFDLATHPHFLGTIREEIHSTHEWKQGEWDNEAFDGLLKLDSAMKETVRLNPPSLTTYSRMMLEDYTLSNGVTLEKGSLICIPSGSKQMDGKVYRSPENYNALRAYSTDLVEHRARPFKSIDADGVRWGTGRWACPGRFLASLTAKVILVKILDEYDIKLLDGMKRPSSIVFHEFIFADENAQLQVRRRKANSGLSY